MTVAFFPIFNTNATAVRSSTRLLVQHHSMVGACDTDKKTDHRLRRPSDMPPPILRLSRFPAEMIACIATHLPPHALLELRLTAKWVAAIIDPVFHKRFFETRYVALEIDSLKNLRDISQHETLRHKVRTVEFCTDHLRWGVPERFLVPEDLADWAVPIGKAAPFRDQLPGLVAKKMVPDLVPEEASPEEMLAFLKPHGWKFAGKDEHRKRVDNQRELLLSDYGVGILSAALSGLSCCRTIGINDCTRPWGMATLVWETGVLPNCLVAPGHRMWGDTVWFLDQMLPLMLTAVASSGVQLQEMYIIPGKKLGRCVPFSPILFDELLELNDYTYRTVRAALRTVSRVCLLLAATDPTGIWESHEPTTEAHLRHWRTRYPSPHCNPSPCRTSTAPSRT
ncbi:hypothetical protein LX36DRAFT_246803 [Colletotrichum falcatum]|nr:hypothetical protein LX36DRAFT_246803 [Colletotrichum falcatum]